MPILPLSSHPSNRGNAMTAVLTAHVGTLIPTRSSPARTWECLPLPPGTVRLLDGTPAAAKVTVTKRHGTGPKCKEYASTYLVSVDGWDADLGLVTRWQKPDGDTHTLTFGGFSGTCTCAACTYETSARGDARHGEAAGSYGCCKLDTLAEIASRRLLPDPRGDAEQDVASHPGEADAGDPEPCDPPYVCTCGRCL